MNPATALPAPEPKQTLLARLERWQWLMPVASFVAGCVSYVAIERGPGLARAVAIAALMSCAWLLLEGSAGRWLNRLSKGRLSPVWACFVTQSLQQELLFFSLPFVLGASQLDIAHGLFVAVLAAAALLSIVDPLYERWVAHSPDTAVAFQVYCIWVAGLVLFPVALHVPVEQAAAMAALLALLAFALALPRLLSARQGLLICIRATVPIAAALGLVTALAQWLPPAGLKLTESRMTTEITGMQPGAAVKDIDVATLRRAGLVAYSAIHAPRGLTQKLSFDWYHEGRCVDRIPAVIQGTTGEKSGWRTWTRKQNFEEDPRGAWRVDIHTTGGQLVGRLPFHVR